MSIEREEPAESARRESKNVRFRGAAEQCFSAMDFAIEQCQSEDEKLGLATALRAAQTLIAATRAHAHVGATAAAREVLDSVLAV